MNDSRTILIIEDDPMIRSMLAAFLVDSGYRVVEAGNGREGLDEFSRAKPDVVLTDLRMPGMNGLEVIAALKAQDPEIPVIAMSGMGDVESGEKAVVLGAMSCLSKPINDLMELLPLIGRAIDSGRHPGQ